MTSVLVAMHLPLRSLHPHSWSTVCVRKYSTWLHAVYIFNNLAWLSIYRFFYLPYICRNVYRKSIIMRCAVHFIRLRLRKHGSNVRRTDKKILSPKLRGSWIYVSLDSAYLSTNSLTPWRAHRKTSLKISSFIRAAVSMCWWQGVGLRSPEDWSRNSAFLWISLSNLEEFITRLKLDYQEIPPSERFRSLLILCRKIRYRYGNLCNDGWIDFMILPLCRFRM